LFPKVGETFFISGEWKDLKEAPDLLKDKDVMEIAEKYKKSAFQVLLRWGLDRGYAVIPKSSEKDLLKENFNIFDFKLT